ncbi:mevalonate kinase [archaeon SCG-AAA382B04]|nr:mevalonate kinase [archaeon SCG-AAA382B04]
MVKATAPGKIYLYGEHSVVYGYPALACAINKRTIVEAQKKNEGITILPKNLSFESVKFKIGGEEGNEIPEKQIKKLDYIRKSIKKIFEIKSEKTGLKLKIRTELPIGGGLGSSASVTVATISALNELYGLNLPRKKISKLAYEVEKEVQGSASPCDTFTSTMGGLTRVEKGKSLEKKKTPKLPIVIGYTQESSNTKQLVEQVKQLKEEYPEIINNLFTSIGEITKRGQKEVQNRDLEKIGELMNINQGILDSIKINNLKLSKLIYAARESGAYGSKITGAGGGGCIIALTDNKEKTANSIKVFGGEPIKTQITNQGVTIE